MYYIKLKMSSVISLTKFSNTQFILAFPPYCSGTSHSKTEKLAFYCHPFICLFIPIYMCSGFRIVYPYTNEKQLY